MTDRWAVSVGLAAMLVAGAAAADAHRKPVAKCAPDAVVAGTLCLDRYEASVWRVPDPDTTNAYLVRRIQQGRATLADLTAGGAVQLGRANDDYAPCADDGQNCAGDIYALSLPAQHPSASLTWFQAQEACANAGKRLPASAEWQVGANGTPDPGPDDRAPTCNSANTATTTLTGARAACVSSRGAFDMVGNVGEWVADWVPISTDCPGWGSLSADVMCLVGATTSETGPGALVRGGFYFGGEINGPLSVIGTIAPSRSEDFIGFRCAR